MESSSISWHHYVHYKTICWELLRIFCDMIFSYHERVLLMSVLITCYTAVYWQLTPPSDAYIHQWIRFMVSCLMLCHYLWDSFMLLFPSVRIIFRITSFKSFFDSSKLECHWNVYFRNILKVWIFWFNTDLDWFLVLSTPSWFSLIDRLWCLCHLGSSKVTDCLLLTLSDGITELTLGSLR